MDKNINYELDLLSNLTWYYDNTDAVSSLIESKAQWYADNYKRFQESWFDSVFNLKTANRFGCVVWAYILDVPTYLVYQPEATRAPWGLGGGRENFDRSNFFGSASLQTLTLDEARRLLRVRYYAQTMSTTVLNINGMLKDVFGDLGPAYLRPGPGAAGSLPFGFGNNRQNFRAPSNFNADASRQNVAPLVQQYVFEFALSSNFKQALNVYLPRGAAVYSSIVSA
jgi:hypothetical protein